MKRVIAPLTVLALAAVSFGQAVTPPTSIETVTTFDASIKRPVVSQVVTQRVGILHDLLGMKGTYLDWRVFGGFDLTDHNVPAGGMAFAVYFQVAKEVTLGIGPVVEFAQKQNTMVGAYVGLQFNFGGK